MPRSKSFEKKGPFGDDSSEDEEVFSAEDTGNDTSSDEESKKKKRRRDLNHESDSDPDDPKPIKKKIKKRELPKKKITLLSEQAIKDKFRYKKHPCALSDLPTKTKVCTNKL